MSEDKKNEKKPKRKKREFPHVNEEAFILKWYRKEK